MFIIGVLIVELIYGLLNSSGRKSSLTFLLRGGGIHIYNGQHYKTQEFHMLLGLLGINGHSAEVIIPALNPWYSFTGAWGVYQAEFS